MDWIGLGPENWTHFQIWYVSHNHLVNFRRIPDYFILTESHKTKAYCQHFLGGFQISGDPRNHAWNNHWSRVKKVEQNSEDGLLIKINYHARRR